MVTDFLDLSKIEQGRMAYAFTSVNLGALIRDLAEEFASIAEKKGLHFEIVFPKETSFVVTADEGKIRQIFSNLIDNAIKYTPEGGVTLSLAKNNVRETILFQIQDTGIGLSQDDIHHLFGKFTRGAEGQKQYTEGSGLGLYVAKIMLEAHRGKIWVDSEGPGKGSTFVVELLDEGEDI